jgi:hypothetical protein
MSRPTTAQITAAVKTLASAPVTNRRLLTVFADCLPAGYALSLQNPRRGAGPAWHVTGTPGGGFGRQEPVVKGQGVQIITRLLQAAWDHAEQGGHPVRTRAEQKRAAAVAAATLRCRECGKYLTEFDLTASAVEDMCFDCC